MYMQLLLDGINGLLGFAGWLFFVRGFGKGPPNSKNMYRFQTIFSVSFLVRTPGFFTNCFLCVCRFLSCKNSWVFYKLFFMRLPFDFL